MTFWILWNPASDRPPKVRFTDIEEARKGAVAMAKRHGGTFHVMRSDGDATGEEKVVRSIEVTTTWKERQDHAAATADYADVAGKRRQTAAEPLPEGMKRYVDALFKPAERRG